MKKLIYLLTFFLNVFLFSIHVNAQAMPELGEGLFQVIEGGMEDAISNIPTWQGLRGNPYTDGITATYEIVSNILIQVSNSSIESVELHTCDANDCVVRTLSEAEIVALEDNASTNGYFIYDRNNNVIDPRSDNLYIVNYNNGFFHGSAYIDNHGDILYYSTAPDFKKTMCDICFGGSYWALGDWNNFVDLAKQAIITNDMNWNPEINNVGDTSLYLVIGEINYVGPERGTLHNVTMIMINNLYNTDFINMKSYQLSTFYLTSESFAGLTIKQNLDPHSSQPPVSVRPLNYTNIIGGKEYPYRLELPWSVDSLSSVRTCSPQDFYNIILNDDSELEGYWLIGCNYPNFDYNNYLDDRYNKTIHYSPWQFDDDVEIHPNLPENEMDLDSLSELAEIPDNDVQPESNPDYDPAEPLDPGNYPIIYPYPGVNPFPVPTPIPKPNPIPDPDPNPTPDPVPTLDPEPTYPDDLMPVGGIPLISNLKNRFPFSIPWDIKNLFQSMQAERVAPHFHWSLYFPIIEYVWEVDIDFSMYNDQALIFRNCFLVLFVIGLAVFAYNHYFGN